MTTKFQIGTMLERLKALSGVNLEPNPNENNWGDVGALCHYASLLRQTTQRAIKEGTHAA